MVRSIILGGANNWYILHSYSRTIYPENLRPMCSLSRIVFALSELELLLYLSPSLEVVSLGFWRVLGVVGDLLEMFGLYYCLHSILKMLRRPLL